MLLSTPSGVALQLEEEKLILDGRGELVFISHAHSDHSAGIKTSRRIIASEETVDLLHSRNYADAVATRSKLARNLPFKYELLDAGHVLGSKQLYLSDNFSFIYTGDFKTRDSLTNRGAEIRSADLLMMETTYGLPFYNFPPLEQVYTQMAHWVNQQLIKGSSVIIGGYSLGKAQEIIKVLNDYCQISPVVSSEIHRISQVYRKYGTSLQMVNETSQDAKEILGTQFVAVVPHHFANFNYARRLSEFYATDVRSAVCTGWALDGNRSVDAAFCLSDHCDFNELIWYAEQVAPRRIITTHGFEKEFARELKKRGFNAEPLSNLKLKPQKVLVEY
ncbi:MAG TPA: MBL fold metallo-hydrolase RNA specificity domain-containing protein [Candidatus Norongarragalinales archaeon]|nr:MBL fold metallo-hydrolase RNA specificity domain-containing protein [Candidatus Norongarragalinales archaeon]